MKIKVFSYNTLDTPIHHMSGLSKFICFLLLTFTVMFSYDIRVILCMLVFSLWVLRLSQIRFSQIRLMVIYVAVFLLTNFVISYLFAPEQGPEIYGAKHIITVLWGRYTITWEQLLYQGTKTMKYASVVPLGIIFMLTTNPSEFAAALAGVGLSYKVAYAVALTLRYFPDVQRDYNDISMAQQARGLDMSKKASLGSRFKNALLIIIPLIFSTLDRVESISNAMDLRGWGKNKKRTWYARRRFSRQDVAGIVISVLFFAAGILVSVFINHSRFFNPFQ
ncbi:MAG: energy-coupling factor transporter transmembrane protein EcfT [Christensenellaceae bacterium]|nr:energy-coupling factor transporter transmembrane protein EcfT [Christensenellaceae bacterium]